MDNPGPLKEVMLMVNVYFQRCPVRFLDEDFAGLLALLDALEA